MWERIKVKWKNWLTQIGIKRREKYLNTQRARLKNHTPTIIANNCIGGFIYRDLNLKYYSPTIDLQIFHRDYMRFIGRMEEYLRCEMVEVFDEKFSYPIGELRLDDEFIRIYFPHATSFEEAKAKWVERCKRVDMDNLYIVFLYGKYLSPRSAEYKRFRAIPYPNKVMLTFPIGIFDRNVVPFFSKRLIDIPGQILKYPHLYSKKRYFNRFDFVKFLNRGHENT